MSNIERVQFYGDELQAVRDGDRVLVAVRPICDALGVSHGSQMNKLKTKAWAVVSMINTTGADGKTYRMAAIPLRAVPMMLATIEPSKVALAIRPKLERYQLECAEALAGHFMPSAPPAPSPPHVDPVIESGARMGDTPEGRNEVRRRCEIAARACKLSLVAVLGFVRRQSRCSSPYYVGDLTWRLKVLPMLDGLAMGHFFLAGPKPRKPKPVDPRQTAMFREN